MRQEPFFFFTKDERFIAKSCTLEEITHIRRSSLMISNYFLENPDSFITRIYGAYKLKIYGTSFYFFVTNNIFLNPNDEVINEKYDLKGSWVKRNSTLPQIGEKVTCTHCNQKYIFTGTKRPEKKQISKKKLKPQLSTSENENIDRCPVQVLGNHEPNVILKDNDLKHKIRLPGSTARFLLIQLEKDTEILCSLGVMDYSLLVGVHNTDYVVDDAFDVALKSSLTTSSAFESKVVKSTKRKDSSILSIEDLSEVRSPIQDSFDSNETDSSRVLSLHPLSSCPRNGRLKVNRIVGPEAYYMGIVDFQQLYNFSKKAERFFKTRVKGDSPEGLSCVEPVTYRQRFLRRMEDLLDIE